ncbi:MAG: glycosyltransferase [Haloarculaceae archaeon]
MAWVVVWSAIIVLAIYALVNAYYLIVHAVSLLELRQNVQERRVNPSHQPFESPFLPGIAIIIPAFNEAQTIRNTVRSSLDQSYPNTRVIVVNDGSTDATLQVLQSAFDLSVVDESPPWDLNCEPIEGIFQSESIPNLMVIDKQNGGKSDALNAGIWLTNQDLFCAIDADSLIDKDGLWHAVIPFLNDPTRTKASGGTVRVANGCSFTGSQVTDVRVSKRLLVGLQEVEYLRAFYSGRLGLSRLGSLLVISGTFGLFRTDAVRTIGGYSRSTVTEDLDLVVRLHRHMLQQDVDYQISFVPEPVVWTQVPETAKDLSTQRRRWYRGLLETATNHRDMIGNPTFGMLGTVAIPLYLLSEGIGPLVETYGYIIVPIAFLLGIVDVSFFITFLLLIIGIGSLLTFFSLISEVWGYQQYRRPSQIGLLIGYAILENFGYRQWKAITAFRGLVDFFQDRPSWGVIERHPFDEEPSE